MALDVVVESLDNVPEAIREEYVERDGRYVLELNGAFSVEDRDRLQGALKKERDEHKSTKERLRSYGELTPEKASELNGRIEELELQIEANGSEDDEARQKKIDELAERRALARVKPVERQLKSLQDELQNIAGERDQLRAEKTRAKIVGSVTSPALLKELGVNSDAVEDIELWALHNFEIDDDGNTVSKETLGTPGLSPKDVFADMKQQGKRRHWFGPTVGAGAGGGRPGDSFEKNPFAAETFSLTRIAQAVKQDPRRAVRMAKAANTKDHNALKFLPKALREQS